MEELFDLTDAERAKVEALRALMGCGSEEVGDQEVYSVLKNQREERAEFQAAMKSFGATSSGRRERDNRGCVIDKPHAPANSGPQNEDTGPRRSPDGKRIDKPFQPRR